MFKQKTNIYISTDMEGIAESCEWDHVEATCETYKKFQKIQSWELSAIVDSINEPCQVLIRDAHASARNVMPGLLSKNVKLIQYWDNDPINMMKGIDKKKFKYAILHGYHAAGGTGLSPLAHTFSDNNFQEFRINGDIVGETTFSIYTAAYFHTPVIYILGDIAAVKEAQKINKHIAGTITKDFDKKNSFILPRKTVLKQIKPDIQRAIESFSQNPEKYKVKLPEHFKLHLKYVYEKQAKLHADALKKVKQIDANTLEYESSDFLDLLTVMRKMKLKM